MPKDIHGKYHPPKGKPSNSSKEDATGIRPDLNNYDPKLDEEMTDKYTDGEDKLAEGVRVGHPNRNRNKHHDKQVPRDQQKQDVRTQGGAGKETRPEMSETSGEESLPGIIAQKSSQPGAQGEALTTMIEAIEPKDLRAKFLEMATYPADVCVSIYLNGPGWEDGLPLKNALRDARMQMENMGIVQVIDQILAPAVWLVNNADFWRSQPRGLALFLAPDYHAMVSLPYPPGNEVHVHTSFILSPLTPVISGESEYFVLTLSQHRAQLFRGKGFDLQPVNIPEMPNGVDDVVHFEEKDGSDLLRSADGAGGASGPNPLGGARGGEGTKSPAFHGVGEGRPDAKKNIELYFREVDRTLHEAGLATEHCPLLLAGLEFELPLFRKVSRYQHILDDQLTGNYDRVPLATLAEASHEKVQAYCEAQLRDKVRHHLDKGTAPVTSFPQDVIRAAYEGRVAQLFLAKGVLLWGKYASAPVEPEIHTEEQPGDDCLTNQVVVQTILHGGQAFVEPREKMPAEGEMVAVLRYS